MLAQYEDIHARSAAPPIWYDDNGTPRYASFHPDLLPNIYAHHALCVEIECQNCGRSFYVGCSVNSLENAERFHYGDPPNPPDHRCVGVTMNCIDRRILSAWEQVEFQWVEVKELRGRDITPDWAKGF